MVEMYLGYQRVNIDKNHIRWDGLLRHRLLYPEEYFHFYHTKIKQNRNNGSIVPYQKQFDPSNRDHRNNYYKEACENERNSSENKRVNESR